MLTVRSILTFTLALSGFATQAHWEDHDQLPRYAHRGVMRASVAPFGGAQLASWLAVDPLAANFNVIFTGQPAWEHPDIDTKTIVEDYLKPRGGNLFFYTCPNSIYFNDEFERVDYREDIRFERYRWDTVNRFPYAKDQITYGRDGKPVLAYVWPSTRYRTSYFSTRWLEHHFEVMDYHVKGPESVGNELLKKWLPPLKFPGINGGFYYDNSGFRQDWGPLAMKRWEAISTREFGKVVDPRESSDMRVRMLWEDMQFRVYVEYCNALRKHAWSYEQPRLSLQSTRGGPGYYAADVDFPDIEFYENSGNMLPETDNIWDVKCGLARTHGKAQALLTHDHFPRPRLDRTGAFRVLNWNLTAEFTRLMMAESLAMNSAHMVQIGPMLYDTKRFGPEVGLYNEFNKRLEEEVYRDARPASRLAVLHSIASEAHGSASNEPLGVRLWREGWAYDVVVEHDITPEIWPSMGMDVLVLPDVRCLNEDRVQVLLDWVRAGGRLLVSQALATRDELGLSRRSPLAPQLLGNIPVRLSYSAAYDCRLEGFVPEKEGRVWLPMNFHEGTKTATGTISLDFSGADGRYDLRVVHLDEDDGVSQIAILKNGEVIKEIKLDKDDNKRQVEKVRNLAMKNGDQIQVRATMDLAGEEFCRIYDIEFIPVGSDLTSVIYSEVGKGLVAYAPQSLMQYTDAELQGMIEKLSGPIRCRVDYTLAEGDMGSVFVNMMSDHAGKGTQVHLVNATYRTPERYATITSTDQVIRAEIPVAEIPAAPALRAQVFGVGEEWQFVATVNGTALAPIPASEIRNNAWIEFPIDPALLKANALNTITIRGAGAVDAYGSHVAIYLETAKTTPLSSYSTDGGATFQTADLSALNGVQTGAYLVEIGEATRATKTPDMRATLVTRTDVEVQLPLDAVPADAHVLMISPDLPARRLPVQREADHVLVKVPELQVYAVLVISTDPTYLDAVEVKVRDLHFDPLPPRTAEFQTLLREGAVGERLRGGALEGDFRLRGVTSIDPATVGARPNDRYFGKDITPGTDFVVFPDGRLEGLPGMPSSLNQIFLTWSDTPGEQYRSPHTPYIRKSEQALLPPGWSTTGSAQNEMSVDRVATEGDYHDGQAGVRVTARENTGLNTGTEWLDIGRPHVASVWVKVLTGKAQVQVRNGDAETLAQVCEPGDWQHVELQFVARAHTVAFSIVGADSEAPSTYLIDTASLHEIPEQ